MKNDLKHIAIIMDGNGRWASQRHHPRFYGHVRGASIVADLVEAASDRGVESLTLYTFSTENFQRPEAEKKILFRLLKKFLLKEFERIIKNNIKFSVLGSIDALDADTQNVIRSLQERSAPNMGMKLNFAFAYGGRAEIVSATNKLLKSGVKEVTEEDFAAELFDPSLQNLDLLIRTGGDVRISNFLLWQVAYAELHFTKTLWPDFSVEEFMSILNNVELRQRRFGKVESYDILGWQNQ